MERNIRLLAPLLVALLAAAHIAACPDLPYDPPPRGAPAPPLHLEGSDFKTPNGDVVNLHGASWFGFNNGGGMVNGLWAGGTAAESDFSYIIWELRLLGLNTLRVPFLYKDLKVNPAPQISGYCTAGATLSDLAAKTLDPDVSMVAGISAPGPKASLPDVSTGTCNSYIPDGPGIQTIDRYLWVVQKLVSYGFYVLVDFHPMANEQVSYDVDEFVTMWKWVWGRIACLPNFDTDLKGRVFVDVLNEPDSMNQGWEPKAGRPGTTELYIKAMDAMWAISPGAPVFFLEGGGQGNYSGLNWGNGFVTDKDIIEYYNTHDANPFFKTLMGKPYLNRVVISPHIYGPSVSTRTDRPSYSGPTFMTALDKAFGYLTKQGYCYQGKCHVFPAVIGEFGSRFTNPEDLLHLHDLVQWMKLQGIGNTGGHAALKNWIYWSYNSNSGDTGGLVDDTWHNFMWVKLRYLMSNFGLRPWWLAASTRGGAKAAAPPVAGAKPWRGSKQAPRQPIVIAKPAAGKPAATPAHPPIVKPAAGPKTPIVVAKPVARPTTVARPAAKPTTKPIAVAKPIAKPIIGKPVVAKPAHTPVHAAVHAPAHPVHAPAHAAVHAPTHPVHAPAHAAVHTPAHPVHGAIHAHPKHMPKPSL